MGLYLQSAFMSPVFHVELHRGAPLYTPMPLQLRLPLDRSSSMPVAFVASVWLVRARPALTLMLLPGVLVQTSLFPFLDSFQIP